MPPPVCKLGVYLVGNDEQIFTLDNGADLFKLLLFERRARRIVGIRHDYDLALFGRRAFHVLGGELESVFALKRDRTDCTADNCDIGHIAHVRRIGHEHFVARANERTQCEVDTFRRADCNYRLVLGIVYAEPVAMLHAAELGRSCGATVVGLTQVGKNSLAQIADYTITTVSEETIFRSEAASTRLTQLAVIDSLIAVVAFQDYEGSFRSIYKIRTATMDNKA